MNEWIKENTNEWMNKWMNEWQQRKDLVNGWMMLKTCFEENILIMPTSLNS